MNDREALVRARAATMTDLRVVVFWIGTPQECERWAGPGISYPLKPQALAEQIDMPSAINVAVEDAHGLAAFGQALPRAPGRVYLARLIVRPDARGRGLGRTLAVVLLTRAAETGATLASTLRLGDAAPLTFEPHVRRRDGRFGFKHEDVYWFDADGKATAL